MDEIVDGLDVREGDGRSDLEMVIGWARTPTGTRVSEEALPASARAAVEVLRADHPDRRYLVLATHTLTDGAETGRNGPEKELPPDDELLALSVVNSEMTTSSIQVTAHTVVVHVLDR